MKKRKDGRYRMQVYTGTVDGKKKYKTVYGHTRDEARLKAADIKVRLGKGINIQSGDESFADWAARYIQNKRLEGMSMAYLSNLEYMHSQLSALDKLPISKITIANIQDVINKKAEWHEGRKPLAKKTLDGIKQFARQTFNTAIAARAVEYNPAQFVTVPKTAASKHRTAIPQEMMSLITSTPHRAQLAAMVMLYAGLRRGEVIALTWADIDLAAGVIHVRRAATHDKKGHAVLKEPKTKAGLRTVSIPTVLADYLCEKQQASATLYICPNRAGSPMSRTSWTFMWNSYMNHLAKQHQAQEDKKRDEDEQHLRTHFTPFTPHQLRHTYASMLYMAGIDVLTAKDQLGHANIQTTLGIYTHLNEQYKTASMGKLNDYLYRSNTGQSTTEEQENTELSQ